MRQPPKITLLGGGVGGAKAAEGLVQSCYGDDVTIIGNIADDDQFHGLWVSPDIDTMTYSLADMSDRSQGWGIAQDGCRVLTALSHLGAECWMHLGDIDFATHIYRTQQRNQGKRPSDIARNIARALGVKTPILLPTDDIVQTRIKTPSGWMSFQEFFVKNRCQPEIEKIEFVGLEHARATGRSDCCPERSRSNSDCAKQSHRQYWANFSPARITHSSPTASRIYHCHIAIDWGKISERTSG